MENCYKLNKQEFLAKEFFWYAVISFFQDEFNPLNWTIWNSFLMIVLFALHQLYVLGSCLTEIDKENGN